LAESGPGGIVVDIHICRGLSAALKQECPESGIQDSSIPASLIPYPRSITMTIKAIDEQANVENND